MTTKILTGVVEKSERRLFSKIMLWFLVHLLCNLEVVMAWLVWVNLNLYGKFFLKRLNCLCGNVSTFKVQIHLSLHCCSVFPLQFCRALLIAFQAFCECVGDLEIGKVCKSLLSYWWVLHFRNLTLQFFDYYRFWREMESKVKMKSG